jgi:hypothetical protein
MFTEYNPEKNEFILVEEPDPSLEYSYADYLKWKFEERVELIRGRIMKTTAPNRKHQEVAAELITLLKNHLRNRPCKAYVAPFDVRISKKGEIEKKKSLPLYSLMFVLYVTKANLMIKAVLVHPIW